ncbi:MAG: GFA family protein [Burkholderiales bacterium]|nr:GFA family protein [Burkholderiales bacterium]
MTADTFTPLDGGCTCGAVRYRMHTRPLFVHCCHCRWCQRETGAAFALNAMIESDRVSLLQGEPEVVLTPSNSGKGQKIARCPVCRIAVWSNYAGAGDAVRFVRVGTLDDPDRLPPDIHIFTASKQPWVELPPGTPAMPEYYDAREHWPPESLERRRVLRAALAAK